jgi:hypothetical protein
MVLLDKSGSLAVPVNPADPACDPAECPGAACPASCPTRLTELQRAFGAVLFERGGRARFGLTTYPTDNACAAPTTVQVAMSTSDDVEAELKARANEVKAAIEAIGLTGTPGDPRTLGGGSATGPALEFLTTLPALQDARRTDYVLLVTDGAPNCNARNPNTCANATACRCTLADCGTTSSAPFCTLGCLDGAATTDAVKALRAVDVKTIVIGYGPDVATGDGAAMLNAMADLGGVARGCPNGTNAECGTGGTCDGATRLCSNRFYAAANGAELEAALRDITAN